MIEKIIEDFGFEEPETLEELFQIRYFNPNSQLLGYNYLTGLHHYSAKTGLKITDIWKRLDTIKEKYDLITKD